MIQKCRGKCQAGGWRRALGVVIRFTSKLAGENYVKCTNCNITFPGMYAVTLSRGPVCPCCLAPCKTNPYTFGRRSAKAKVHRHA